jgi:hypothetical protein
MLNTLGSFVASAVNASISYVSGSNRPKAFDANEFETVVFTKSALLTIDAEQKYKFALQYCQSIRDHDTSISAAIYFDKVICEKKNKISAKIQEDSSINPLKRKLQFSFRFLPFMAALVSTEEAMCVDVLLENLFEAYADPILTCNILAETNAEYSTAVKLSVVLALEDILFPSKKFTFKNLFWNDRFFKRGEIHYLPIYMVYLLILKCWDFADSNSPTIRSLFCVSTRQARINPNHKYNQVCEICFELLSAHSKFSLLSGLEEVQMFKLGIEIYESWRSDNSFNSMKFDKANAAFFRDIFSAMNNMKNNRNFNEV